MSAGAHCHESWFLADQRQYGQPRRLRSCLKIDTRYGDPAQLDQNIEHLACLGDRIRNPLAVIVGLADLQGGEIAEKIVKQAEIIDGVLRELDSGYAASLSAREFLRKHHLRDDLDLDAPPRTEITRPVSGLAKQVSHQSGLFMDTHAPLD